MYVDVDRIVAEAKTGPVLGKTKVGSMIQIFLNLVHAAWYIGLKF